MKISATVARYLLGVAFTIFGLNGFLQFIPAPPPTGLAGDFFGALVQSRYAVAVFLVQLVAGLLFLWGRYVPLALTLIGPVIVNILLFHLTMDLAGIGPGVVVTICWFLVFYRYRAAFAGIFLR